MWSLGGIICVDRSGRLDFDDSRLAVHPIWNWILPDLTKRLILPPLTRPSCDPLSRMLSLPPLGTKTIHDSVSLEWNKDFSFARSSANDSRPCVLRGSWAFGCPYSDLDVETVRVDELILAGESMELVINKLKNLRDGVAKHSTPCPWPNTSCCRSCHIDRSRHQFGLERG
jgi:hypothetical protein